MSQAIAADYTLRPSELAECLTMLVAAQQPVMVWSAPGMGKSQIAQQVAAATGRKYVDIRALLLDPVDLRGIPWRDTSTGMTRWAPPAFLPPMDSTDLWLLNLEEVNAAVQMVQGALYQLTLDRMLGEYKLPEGAAIIACGNREGDRGVVHRMPTPLASRFVHLDLKVDKEDWQEWALNAGIEPETMFFVESRPELLHQFDPKSAEKAFPCPRTWEFADRLLKQGKANGGRLDPETQRTLYRGTVGQAAAVEFTAFLKLWRELPHPKQVISDPSNAPIPGNQSTLLALCGSLYRLADDINFDAIVTYATRLRREVGEFLVSRCIKRDERLGNTPGAIRWYATRTQ